METFDLFIEYENEEDILIPDVTTEEVLDFIEEHDEARGFFLLRAA